MKHCFALATLLVLHTPAVFADDAADRQLAKYFEAAGGSARLAAVHTRVSEGTLEMPGGRAGITLQQKAPNLAVLELRLPRGTMRRGFDGSHGWESSSVSGNRPMAAPMQAAFAEEHSLASTMPDAIFEKFPKRELLKDGQLRMTKADGAAETWTFDPATHLLSRIEREIDGGPQGIVPVTILLEDYKKAGDILLPHTIRSRTKVSETVLRLESIHHGDPLDNTLFTEPGGRP